MATSARLVWMSPASALRSLGLELFLVQLGLNLGRSLIFFRMHATRAALAEVLILWAGIRVTTLVFRQVSPIAALIMPYWA